MKRENLVKFYQSYKLYIFPAVVVLSSLFLMVFLILPQTVKLIDNQQAIGDLTNKSKFLETKVAALESYNEQDLSKKVEFALSVLPADKDFGNILGFLQVLANQSGFSIGSISFGGGRLSGNSNSFEATLQIKGAKVLFQTLLNNLENSPRLVRISSIDISSGQSLQTLDGSLVLEVLYAPAPLNFGSADTPLPEINEQDEQLLSTLASQVVSVGQTPTISSTPRGKLNPFE